MQVDLSRMASLLLMTDGSVFLFSLFDFKRGSLNVAQAGLKLTSLLLHVPGVAVC